MPTTLPFRGLTYAPSLGDDLGRLIAPPYDVISEKRRAALGARHPNNIVHIDLPRSEGREDAHQVAGRRLQEWVGAGILRRDELAAFYGCEQRYRTPTGEERTRRGFFARLRLEGLDSGVVIAHERTLEAPRKERQGLLAATRTHVSAIFMLHPDPGGAVSSALERLWRSAAFREARDDDGTMIRAMRIDDPADTAFLQQRLEGSWALIADGHHRYESALAYREERRAAGQNDADHALVYLCSLEDPGLSIFPIHRLVHSLRGFNPEEFRRSLEDRFTLKQLAGPGDVSAALDSAGPRPGVFGLVFGTSPSFWLAQWKEGTGLDRPGIAAIPDPLRGLDVILLHRLVFEATLGITPEAQACQEHLRYVNDAKDLMESVARGGADLGVLLNPTRIGQVIEVSRQRLRLPQKSTYFYPKVPTGLVLDPLDD